MSSWHSLVNQEHSNLKTSVVRGRANGYGQGHEAGDGGKCPLCGSPILEQSRFCRECTPKFTAFLYRIYGYNVKFARLRELTGGVVTAAKRRRRRTLDVLRSSGPSTASEIAQVTRMTTNGTRMHLKQMQEDGEVSLVKGGYRHIWQANEKD